MHNKEIVLIIIPTYNCVDKINSTIDSAINQSFPKGKFKIVAIDNCSTDGTYEKLLDYARKNKEIISIYRLSEATKPTIVLQKAMNLLKDVPVAYSTILKPGDLLNSNFINKCVSIFESMNNFKGKLLICETDLIDECGHLVQQNPIYMHNCILKGSTHYEQYITSHIDHKIQAFYKGVPISTLVQLHEILHIIDFTDWFNKICNFMYINLYVQECLYVKEKLGVVRVQVEDNPINLLMQKLFILERIYCIVDYMPTISMIDKIDEDVRKKSFKGLAILALKYAIQQIKKGKNEKAHKCMLFSQMVCLDIITDEMYVDIKEAVTNEALVDNLSKYEKQEYSMQIPENSFSF